jgi:hypothetical protein
MSEIDDFNRSWTWKEHRFDYIHLKNLAGNVADWPHLFGQAFKCLRPGGYLESHEQSLQLFRQGPIMHDTTLDDSIEAIDSWNSVFRSMKDEPKVRRSFTVADDKTQWEAMNKAGFVDLKWYYERVSLQIELFLGYKVTFCCFTTDAYRELDQRWYAQEDWHVPTSRFAWRSRGFTQLPGYGIGLELRGDCALARTRSDSPSAPRATFIYECSSCCWPKTWLSLSLHRTFP